MSQILQNILEPNIRRVLQEFGSEQYLDTAPQTPRDAQEQFIKRLSNAIAVSVQQYLASNVNVIPGQITVGGPASQVTTTPGILNAP
jgi:hypothetical protein